MLIRRATAADFGGILQLQELNLYANLAQDEHANGFVTTPFNTVQLESLLMEDSVFVALDEGMVVGYILAGTWQYYSIWPIFRHMVTRFPIHGPFDTPIRADNCFQYGPICIADNYRGSDMLLHLFEYMRLAFSNRFPIGYTFINRVNQRSLNAHTRKLGLQITDQFEFDDRSYYGLAFDTKRSVMKSSQPGVTSSI